MQDYLKRVEIKEDKSKYIQDQIKEMIQLVQLNDKGQMIRSFSNVIKDFFEAHLSKNTSLNHLDYQTPVEFNQFRQDEEFDINKSLIF